MTPLACAAQARTALHRADVPAARRQLVMAQRLRPVLTYTLPHFAVQARIELARAHLALAGRPGASVLTGAELRLQPLLPSHLSFPEIGAGLFLSPHTVKSRAFSMYRKLGVSTRSQAVTRVI